MQDIMQRKRALLAETKTETLLDTARALESLTSPSQDERMVSAWVFDELEERVGKLTLDEEPAFEQAYDATGNYLKALLAVRPELGEFL